jgi:hypothetical protein
MTAARRLVTSADIVEHSSPPRSVGVAARHELELMDGRRVLLLDDRGWGSSDSLARATAETISRTARMVVGPDAPPPGRSKHEMDALHWDFLQQIAQRQGVIVGAAELMRLPHDVVLSERLLARVGANAPLA